MSPKGGETQTGEGHKIDTKEGGTQTGERHKGDTKEGETQVKVVTGGDGKAETDDWGGKGKSGKEES